MDRDVGMLKSDIVPMVLWHEDCMFHGPMGIPEGCGLGIGYERAMDRDIGMLRSCAVPMVLWYSCACSVVPMGTPEGCGPRHACGKVPWACQRAVVLGLGMRGLWTEIWAC